MELSDEPGGPNIQGGKWDCSAVMGQNMLELARTAKVMNNKVTVIFEGDGSEYKPVYAIRLE